MILALEAGGNAAPAKAMKYQEELVAKYPEDERAHFLLGNGYFGRQDYDKAIEQYRAATDDQPALLSAYNLLGYAYRAVENTTMPETSFKKYIELVPGDPNPYDSYAELLMKTGRFDESIAQYRKALAVDSHFTASQVGIATNLMFQGKPDEAAAAMDDLYRRARDDGDRRTALFVKGVILVDAGRPTRPQGDRARVRARRTLADSANMSGDTLLIGNILLDAGRTDEAAKRFRQALDLVEKSGLSAEVKQDTRLADHYNRARIALGRGELATARAEARSYAEGRRCPAEQLPGAAGSRAGGHHRAQGEAVGRRAGRAGPGKSAGSSGGLLDRAGVAREG